MAAQPTDAEPNPFASPQSDPTDTSRPRGPSIFRIAWDVFLQWEMRRPLYIVILACVTLASGFLLAPGELDSGHFWWVVFQGAVVANVCYFAGPFVETVVAWLGGRTAGLRRFLFISGTVFAGGLALVSLFDEYFGLAIHWHDFYWSLFEDGPLVK